MFLVAKPPVNAEPANQWVFYTLLPMSIQPIQVPTGSWVLIIDGRLSPDNCICWGSERWDLIVRRTNVDTTKSAIIPPNVLPR